MSVAAVLALLVVHNLVTNLWAPPRWYVPVNLCAAGLLVALAGPADVGLSLGNAPVAGVAAALVVLGVVALVAVVPRTRPLLADRRMAGVDATGTAWRARALVVAAAVAATTVVGVALWELRVATSGLFAPALVHAAASGATVAAYLVLRSAAAEAAPEGVAAAHLPPDVAAEHAEQQPS